MVSKNSHRSHEPTNWCDWGNPNQYLDQPITNRRWQSVRSYVLYPIVRLIARLALCCTLFDIRLNLGNINQRSLGFNIPVRSVYIFHCIIIFLNNYFSFNTVPNWTFLPWHLATCLLVNSAFCHKNYQGALSLSVPKCLLWPSAKWDRYPPNKAVDSLY